MGESALVDSGVLDAVELIKKLDENGRPPTLAAWYYYDDADEWRLLLASPELDQLLVKQESVAYKAVIEALNSLPRSSLAFSQLKIIGTASPLAGSLRFLVKTSSAGIVRAHFTNMTLNGLFIKEVIILRVTPNPSLKRIANGGIAALTYLKR